MAEILHKDLTGADLHEPKAHKTSHQIGGSDVVNPDWSLINNKPISTVANIDDAVTKKHTQNTDTDLDATFEATLEHTANKGIVSGYASLDASALVPLAQIPIISDSKLSNIAFNKIIQSGKAFRLISFDTYDMIATVVAGSGTVTQTLGLAKVATGTTANSYARQNFNAQSGMGLYSGDLTGWFIHIGLLTGDTVGFIGGIRNTLLTTEVNHTLTAKHAGLFYDNGVFYASSGDGTSQQLTDVSALISGQNWLKIYFDGSSVYFYWGDTLIATHTTYLASYLYQQLWVSNKANAVNSTMQIYNFYRKGSI